MAAFLSVILVTSLSDHFKRRGIFMLICSSIAIIGYVMLIATSKPHIQYGGTFFVAAGSFACPPIVMGKPPLVSPHLSPPRTDPPSLRLASKQHFSALRTSLRLRASNRHRQHRCFHRNLHLYCCGRPSVSNWPCNKPRYVRVVFGGY